MRALLLACAAAVALTGCQSTEEKIKARYMNWFAACGHPQGSTIPYEEKDQVVACVRDLEASYQAERSRNVAKGAAMLGYGSALMASPSPVPPAPVPRSPMNCTTMSPATGVITTRCR
jgi:hypothetical protein